MGPEQWLFLQWHEHKGSLVSMFEKLFERNTFVDCTLAAEGQYLNVHKVILSACSPYFELLLNENRDKHPIIILKDVKFRSLKSIIEYMYRGEANVLSSDIKDFLAAAESLQIKGIGKHGGDTKNQPKKALQDFVEGEGRSPHSPKIYPGSGDNDKRTVTDFHEIKSDDEDDESGRDKNFCYIENVEHHSNISPQKIPVPIITSETNAETQWLKAESPEDTAQYLMSMPTLNIGACTTDIVHPGLKETVPERTANKISTQNVLPCDVQMKKAEMSRSETKCELQPASPIVDNEVADSASQASSVRELSDTAEEWAEEEMEEALTHSHTTGNSVVGGTDESRAHFDGGSDATRESRDLGSDQQGKQVAGKELSGKELAVKVASPETRSMVEVVEVKPKPDPVLYQVLNLMQSLERHFASMEPGNSSGTVDRPAAESPSRRSRRRRRSKHSRGRRGSEKSRERRRRSRCSQRSQRRRLRLRPRGGAALHARRSLAHQRPPARDHRCVVCGQRFCWLNGLKQHLRTHDGETLFKCKICGFTNGCKGEMLRHISAHNLPKRSGLSEAEVYTVRNEPGCYSLQAYPLKGGLGSLTSIGSRGSIASESTLSSKSCPRRQQPKKNIH